MFLLCHYMWITGGNDELVIQFKMKMMKCFEMLDLGEFLERKLRKGIFISQQKYAQEIHKKVSGFRPISTPMNKKDKLIKEGGSKKEHFKATKRVLIYIKGFANYGVKYNECKKLTYMDFLIVTGQFKETRSYCIINSRSRIFCYCKAINQAIWIRKLLVDLHEEQKKSKTKTSMDSQATIAISRI
ncbi:hypothetical protein CR513_02233, partial [Mucuna pruriens]